MMKSQNKLSICKHPLSWIALSTICVSTIAYLGMQFFYQKKKSEKIHEGTHIVAIVQTGPQKEALKTDYLVELLEISKDHPPCVSEFNLAKAKEKLLSSPVIKSVELKLIHPGILFIDYLVRQPVALIHDFENIAIDEEGYLFPLNPFFSPKNLPEIYLGLSDIQWNVPISDERIKLAFSVLKLMTKPILYELFNPKLIDVSHAMDESYGHREIVVRVEDELIAKIQEKEFHFLLPRYLRLSTKNYNQELANYLKLRDQMLDNEKRHLKIPNTQDIVIRLNQQTIDFRIPHLAFIDEK